MPETATATAPTETEAKPTTDVETPPATTPEAQPFPAYSRIGFYGSVQFRPNSWFRAPNGAVHSVVMGLCSVFKDTELVGFEVKGNDTNWAVVVEGDLERHVILGCQIGAVTSYQLTKDGPVNRPATIASDVYIVP